MRTENEPNSGKLRSVQFRKLGLIEYNGGLKVKQALLSVVCTTDSR